MAYQLIDNFAFGLDTRKSPLTSPAGTLTRLKNAVITPGGEVQKRRAFVRIADLPANSFGLATTESELYIFGKNTTPTPPSVSGLTIRVLNVPNTDPNILQYDFDVFDGKVYLVCYAPSQPWPGVNPHYWDNGDVGGVMAVTEGTGKGYYVRAYQSKVYSVAGKYLYFSALNNPLLWDAPLSGVINLTYLGNTNPAGCLVALADIGYFHNGMQIIIAGATGDMAAANGQWYIYGVDAGLGSFYLYGCNLSGAAAPQTSGVTANPVSATGQGFINLSLQDADAEVLVSLEVYYSKLAVFSSQSTQIWAVDPDPLQNSHEQLLRGNGTKAARSPLQYGNGDVLFLDESGIRSLRARDSSNSASVSDIGSPIDSTLQELRRTRGSEYMNSAISLLEPSVGRFWLVFPDQVFVLSYFPSPKITAWSQFTLPFAVQHAVTCGGKIYFRDTENGLWVYGGLTGNTYDACNVEVRLPYLDGKKPGHLKQFHGFDATVSGEWWVSLSTEYTSPDEEDVIATINKPTWNIGRNEVQAYASHFSLRFYNYDSAEATLSNVAVHYDMADSETT